MIERISAWCTGNRFPVFTGSAVLVIWDAWALRATPLDEVPDVSDAQVIASTEWAGAAPISSTTRSLTSVRGAQLTPECRQLVATMGRLTETEVNNH